MKVVVMTILLFFSFNIIADDHDNDRNDDATRILTKALFKTKDGKRISRIFEFKLKKITNKYDLLVLTALKPILEQEIILKKENMYIKYELNKKNRVSVGVSWDF